jgi:lipoyl(octanoyl) transferase
LVNIIPFKKYSGKYNMDFDRYLFEQYEQGSIPVTLRIYGWEKPCISLGYSQDPDQELNRANCEKNGIEIVKRPTGGGIVFHNEHEVTYSIICDKDDPKLPKGLVESYVFISNIVIGALKKVGVNADISDTRHHEQARLCFSFPASYEIMLEGIKIVGSAQKRGKKALLQQGSIFIRNSELKPADFIRNCIEFKSIYDILGVEIDQNMLANALSAEFLRVFGDS